VLEDAKPLLNSVSLSKCYYGIPRLFRAHRYGGPPATYTLCLLMQYFGTFFKKMKCLRWTSHL